MIILFETPVYTNIPSTIMFCRLYKYQSFWTNKQWKCFSNLFTGIYKLIYVVLFIYFFLLDFLEPSGLPSINLKISSMDWLAISGFDWGGVLFFFDFLPFLVVEVLVVAILLTGAALVLVLDFFWVSCCCCCCCLFKYSTYNPTLETYLATCLVIESSVPNNFIKIS